MQIEEAKQILGKKFSFIYDDIIGPVFKLINISKNAKILDIGTGEGRMAISLALNDYSVLTGEPESDFSEYAKRDWLGNAKKVNIDHLIMFKAFDAEKMPFDDNEFDVIFMMSALHHMNDKGRAMKECIRIVKQRKSICIIEPNDKGIEIIRKQSPSHPDPVDPRDYLNFFPVKIKKGFMFNAYIFQKVE